VRRSGPLLKVRLAAPPDGGKALWLLVKAAPGTLARSQYFVGSLVEAEKVGYDLSNLRSTLPFVLDCNFRAFPQMLFAIGLLAAMVTASYHLNRLYQELRFPITHPLMSSLASFSNDGNPVPVMAAINCEMELNLQGEVQGAESELHITDSWIFHARALTLEVAFFPDVARIEPLYDFANGGVGGGHLSGLQIFCRRGRDFFVPMTTAQFELIQDNMHARFQATQEVRSVQTHEAQLERLRRVVEVTGTYEQYTMQVGEDGELDSCVVMCGAKVEVKVLKRCTTEMTGSLSHVCDDRRECFCQPSMCLSCLAKWFGENERTTCPTCRVQFCMHDVVPVQTAPRE